jgi:hypothetical protein
VDQIAVCGVNFQIEYISPPGDRQVKSLPIKLG